MTDIFIDFEWYRNAKGYKLVPWKSLAGPDESYPHGDCIVDNGGKWISYRPLDQFDMLCCVFARVKTPNDLLKFIHTFGPLGRGGFAAGVSGPEPVRGGATWGDDVSSGLRQAKFFRDLLL